MDANQPTETGGVLRSQQSPPRADPESRQQTAPNERRMSLRSMENRALRSGTTYAEATRMEPAEGNPNPPETRPPEETRPPTTQTSTSQPEVLHAEATRAGGTRSEPTRSEVPGSEPPHSERAHEEAALREGDRRKAARSEAQRAGTARAETERAETERAETVRAEAERAETIRAFAAEADAHREHASRAEAARERTQNRAPRGAEEQMRGDRNFSNLFHCLDDRGPRRPEGRPGGPKTHNPPRRSSTSSSSSRKYSGTNNRSRRSNRRPDGRPPWQEEAPSEEDEYPPGRHPDSGPNAARHPEEATRSRGTEYPRPSGQTPSWGDEQARGPAGNPPQMMAPGGNPWPTYPYPYRPWETPYWNMGWDNLGPAPARRQTEQEALEAWEKQAAQALEKRERAYKELELKEKELLLRLELCENASAGRQTGIAKTTAPLHTATSQDHRSSTGPPAPGNSAMWPEQRRDEPDQDGRDFRMKPDRFDGVKTEWPEYKKHFDIWPHYRDGVRSKKHKLWPCP